MNKFHMKIEEKRKENEFWSHPMEPKVIPNGRQDRDTPQAALNVGRSLLICLMHITFTNAVP